MGNVDRLSEAIAGLEGEGTEERVHKNNKKNIKSRTYSITHRPTPLFGKCCFAPSLMMEYSQMNLFLSAEHYLFSLIFSCFEATKFENENNCNDHHQP